MTNEEANALEYIASTMRDNEKCAKEWSTDFAGVLSSCKVDDKAAQEIANKVLWFLFDIDMSKNKGEL